MTRTFVYTEEFIRNWERMELTDEELRKLELMLLKSSHLSPIIKGTGGLRKIRFALRNRGKRGSIRICYVDFAMEETIYLITVYPKNEKESLSKEECSNIKKAIELLKHNLKQGV